MAHADTTQITQRPPRQAERDAVTRPAEWFGLGSPHDEMAVPRGLWLVGLTQVLATTALTLLVLDALRHHVEWSGRWFILMACGFLVPALTMTVTEKTVDSVVRMSSPKQRRRALVAAVGIAALIGVALAVPFAPLIWKLEVDVGVLQTQIDAAESLYEQRRTSPVFGDSILDDLEAEVIDLNRRIAEKAGTPPYPDDVPVTELVAERDGAVDELRDRQRLRIERSRADLASLDGYDTVVSRFAALYRLPSTALGATLVVTLVATVAALTVVLEYLTTRVTVTQPTASVTPDARHRIAGYRG